MSQLAAIENAQKDLEQCFSKRMTELEAQLHSGATGKETVAKVADEFRTFRELVYSMLGLLRKQINECTRQLDLMESRHRRKALIFLGVAEQEKEDCTAIILDAVSRVMALKDITAASIENCYRIGTFNKDRHRPILVKFNKLSCRSAVWSAKSRLKGSATTVREFLTKPRQLVFTSARQHFGMRTCWTQDGVVVVKTSDGHRHKVVTSDQLNVLIKKFPKSPGNSSQGNGSGAGRASPAAFSKPRKL